MRQRLCKIDFTSANYLGIHHQQTLLPQQTLTHGKPAALYESPLERTLAKEVAHLQGFHEGMLYTSSLHLFWDLFDQLAEEKVGICVDEWAYPVARWTLQAAIAKGRPVQRFRHKDLSQLKQQLRLFWQKGFKPLILTDGWCNPCGHPHPIAAYQELLIPLDGLLIIDDTQAIGILGEQPSSNMPYGFGGGGSLQWLGLPTQGVLTGCSFAKALGVPIAGLSGNQETIGRLRRNSQLRWHCSPPSFAHLEALKQSLHVNKQRGNSLRQKLWYKVKAVQKAMNIPEIQVSHNIFPQQKWNIKEQSMACLLQRKLTDERICYLRGKNSIGLIFRANTPKWTVEKLLSVIHQTKRETTRKKNHERLNRRNTGQAS